MKFKDRLWQLFLAIFLGVTLSVCDAGDSDDNFDSNLLSAGSAITAGESVSYANYVDNTTFNITVSEGKFEILNVNTEKTPTLGLYRGYTYYFNLNDTSTNSHPFIITSSSSGGSFNDEYTNGVTNSRATTGILTFEVPSDAPSTLYYNCGYHSGMGGMIKINP